MTFMISILFRNQIFGQTKEIVICVTMMKSAALRIVVQERNLLAINFEFTTVPV